MFGWRILFTTLLIALIGVPVLLPLAECFAVGELAFLVTDADYLIDLTLNTLYLVAGTLLVSLPVGLGLAVLLFRTDLPGRRFWIAMVLLVLFVPLPMLMSAWTAFLGSGGIYPLPGWEINLSRAWTVGLAPAIWVHSLAGIPWVILIVGNGLCWIERELEDEALMHVGPWRALARVTLPRCGGSLAAAALWLGLATFAEIGVTNYLQLPTLAEEVQTQFSSGTRSALAQSVLLSLPTVLSLTGLLLWLTPRLERSLPPLQGWLAAPRPFPLGRARWPIALLLTAAGIVLALAPLMSLVWKVGAAGHPPAWSFEQAWARLLIQGRLDLPIVLVTLLTAAGTALVTTWMGLVVCWPARDSRWFRALVLTLMILAWSLPGPVVGVGLKDFMDRIIRTLIDWHLPYRTVDDLLYQGLSPVPIMWAQFIRFLPVATALLWPWVRTVPPELLEAARLEGARPLQELLIVIRPLVARGLGWTFLVLTALCLSEVAASNRVETVGWETFAKVLLDRMHYGVDSTVAALCLLLLGCLMIVMAIAIASQYPQRWAAIRVSSASAANSTGEKSAR